MPSARCPSRNYRSMRYVSVLFLDAKAKLPQDHPCLVLKLSLPFMQSAYISRGSGVSGLA